MPDTTPSPAPAARSSSASYDNSSSTAGRLAQNSVFERFARAGFVVSGIVHLIIGYIAIRLALGGAAGTADQSGAMTELAAKPGGIAALWVGVVAFAIMGLWRLAEAALGSSSRPDADSKKSEVIDRLKAFALAVVYFAFAFSAFGFARGSGKSSSGQSAGITARLMQSTAGTIVLVAGALVIIAVGGYHVYKGVSRSFLDDLEGTTSPLVRRLGMVGYIAKGLAIAAIGLLVILAVSQSEPDKATGLDGAFKTVGAQPYGAALLIAAGVGIITYGLYSFAMARYAKM
ncbi:membrane protein [Rhodococcus rhodochrous]|nr:membrane protein [Rhodococcus rhodochrous]